MTIKETSALKGSKSEAGMKKRFQILKSRPTLNIRLTRDSVCAGDDIDAPHQRTIKTHSFLDPVALASHLSSVYLPKVNGVGHSWDCTLNGKTFASISMDGIVARVAEMQYDSCNHIHFAYHSAKY
ncbi:MAG: hypothetical protein JRE63_04750 [Deltaproteobacteria bacterium]|jgi:hypothetical protein|nr:hypothetical protein [Deltaproteobacteria bacterium]